MVSTIMNPKAALHNSQDPSFEKARIEANDNIPISARRVALKDESAPWTGEMATAANVEPHIKHENCQESIGTKNEDVVAREVKFFIKDFVARELSNMVEEPVEKYYAVVQQCRKRH